MLLRSLALSGLVLGSTFAAPTAHAFDDDDFFDDLGDLKRGGSGDDDDDDDKKKKRKETAEEVTEAAFDLGDDPSFDIVDEGPDEPPLGDFGGDFGGPQAAAPTAPAGPGPLPYDVLGKAPLGDNYALEVVHVDRDAVVVELPVLVAYTRGAVPEGFQIVAELSVDGTRAATSRHLVTPDGVALASPTFAFLKLQAPVTNPTGEVQITVSKADLDGGNPTELFTRAAPYALAGAEAAPVDTSPAAAAADTSNDLLFEEFDLLDEE